MFIYISITYLVVSEDSELRALVHAVIPHDIATA
jgi:hypothetical protein